MATQSVPARLVINSCGTLFVGPWDSPTMCKVYMHPTEDRVIIIYALLCSVNIFWTVLTVLLLNFIIHSTRVRVHHINNKEY